MPGIGTENAGGEIKRYRSEGRWNRWILEESRKKESCETVRVGNTNRKRIELESANDVRKRLHGKSIWVGDYNRYKEKRNLINREIREAKRRS